MKKITKKIAIVPFAVSFSVFLSACEKSTPSVVNNYYNKSDSVESTKPVVDQQKVAFLDNQKNKERIEKLNNIILNSKLTLETKKMLRNLVYSELATDNSISLSQVASYVSSTGLGAFAKIDDNNISQFKTTAEKVVELRHQRERDMAILSGTGKGVELLFDVATLSAAGTGLGAVSMGSIQAVKTATIKTLDYAFSKVEQDMKDKAQAYFAQSVENQKVSMAMLESLKNKPEEEAVKLAEGMALELTKSLQTPEMNAEERKESLILAAHYIGRVALDYSVSNGVQLKAVQSSVQDLEKGLVTVTRVLNGFSKEMKGNVDRIASSQEELTNLVQKYQESLSEEKNPDTIKDKTEFLKDFLSGKLNDVSRLKSAEDQAQVEILNKQKELWKSLSSYANATDSLIVIAKNVGFDPNVVNDISKANDFYKTGLQVYQNILSGNYLQSVALVSGLFSGGQVSLEDARHQEINGKLDKILAAQDIIISNQTKIMDGVNRLLEGQVKQMEALSNISKQIYESTELLYGELLGLRQEMVRVSKVVDAIYLRDLQKCEMLDQDLKEQSQLNNGNPFKSLINIENQIADELQICVNAQNDIFTEKSQSKMFYLNIDLGFNRKLSKETINAFDYRNYYLVYDFLNLRDDDKVSLSNPVNSALDLVNKNKSDIINKSGGKLFFGNYFILPQERLNPFVIAQSTQSLLETLPFTLLYRLSPNDAKLDLDSIIDLSVRGEKKSQALLENAFNWVRAAIIQENVMNGDILLEKLYGLQFIDEDMNCSKTLDQGRNIQCYLLENKMLYKNFGVYAIRRLLEDNDVHPSAFKIAWNLALKNDNVMELDLLRMSKNPLKFEVSQGKLFISLGKDVKIEVPSYEEILNGKLMVSPVMDQLLSLQKRILQMLAEMDAVNSSNSQQKIELFNLVK